MTSESVLAYIISTRNSFTFLSSHSQPRSTMSFDLASLPPVWQKAILEGPALQPPPGVQPDFFNPPNQNSLGYALIIMCAVVSTLMTGIRVYAKLTSLKRLGIEDCKFSLRICSIKTDFGKTSCWQLWAYTAASCISPSKSYCNPVSTSTNGTSDCKTSPRFST